MVLLIVRELNTYISPIEFKNEILFVENDETIAIFVERYVVERLEIVNVFVERYVVDTLLDVSIPFPFAFVHDIVLSHILLLGALKKVVSVILLTRSVLPSMLE